MGLFRNLRRRLAKWIAPSGPLQARYDAARRRPDDRYWANADSMSARAANNPGVRKILRERSRYERDNNGYIAGTVGTRTNDIVGCLPRLCITVPITTEDGNPDTLTPDEIAAQKVERAWSDWCDNVGLQDKLLVLEESQQVDGESFLVATRNARLDNPVQLDVTVIEADQCTTPLLQIGQVDGIETDGNGNPIAYHFLKQHPGDVGLLAPTAEYTRVPAEDVIHWFRPRRAGQARGVPDTVAALPLSSELRRYTTATRQTAETQAKIAAVLLTDQPPPDDGDEEFSPTPFESKEVELNSLMSIPHQWDVKTLNPSQPAQGIDTFSKVTLQEMGRGMATPLNIISGNSSDYNFSSARLDSIVYRGDRTVQRSRHKRTVMDRLYSWWYREATLVGAIPTLPDGWVKEWYYDGFPFIDPQAEATAEGEELNNGTTTLQDVCGKRGRDWREVIRQRAREKAMSDAFGLTPAPAPTATTPPTQPGNNQDQAYAANGRLMLRADLPSEVQFVTAASEKLELEAAEIAADGQPAKLRKFNMTAYTGVPMRLPNYPHPVVADLEGMDVPSMTVPILKGHEHTAIVGHTTTVDKAKKSIKASGLISGTGEAATEVVTLAGNGFPWGASIGASIEKLEFVAAGESVVVNTRKVTGPAYVARKSTLREISVTPVGADPSATTAVAASANKGIPMNEFDKWLTAQGFDIAALSDSQRAALQAAWEASKKPASTPNDLDGVLASRRAEQDRQTGIANLVMQATENRPDFLADAEKIGRMAIAGSWDLAKTELELLRAGRTNLDVRGWVGSDGRDDKNSNDVLECSLARSSGMQNLDKHYSEQILEASHKRHKQGVTICELFFLAAQQRGYRGSPRDFKGMVKAAYSGDIKGSYGGGYSTIDVAGILSNNANKFVIEAYNFVESEWRKVSARRTVNDFKEITSYSLTGDLEYEMVAPGGSIPHGKLGEDSVTNKADTYGKMLALTYQDLRNDDLNAFVALNRKIGRGGALKLNNVFWTEWLADLATFYTVARGNYDAGSDTLMDLTGLANAEDLFEKQTDPDGNPLGVMPAIVVVPPKLWPAAWTLTKSPQLNFATSNAASTGTDSPWAGMFQLVKSRYLAMTALGGDSLRWWLIADPNDVPVVEVAFLDGVELPAVETGEMDFDTLGMPIRGVHHFGVRKQHYRGGVMMKGGN